VPPTSAADGLNVAVLPLTLTVPATGIPSVVVTKVKLPLFNVVLVIASENVADIEELTATLDAVFAGEVEETNGAVISAAAPVVKLQLKLLSSALPDASFTALVIIAVYCVFARRLAEGTSVAVLPLTTTCPAIAPPPAVRISRKFPVFRVALAIGSEKVADTEVLSATPVVPFGGAASETIGGVASGSVEVRVDASCAGATIGGSPVPAPQPNKVRMEKMLANNIRAVLTFII
jgi:hypothetical protein